MCVRVCVYERDNVDRLVNTFMISLLFFFFFEINDSEEWEH